MIGVLLRKYILDYFKMFFFKIFNRQLRTNRIITSTCNENLLFIAKPLKYGIAGRNGSIGNL